MDSSDVVIVGGGPAGSACAWRLASHGISSVVLDSQDFPRTKLCAGWITPKVLDDLKIVPPAYPHGIVRLDKIRVEYCGRRRKYAWTIPTRQYSIRRYEFDWWLLRRSGAKVRKQRVARIRVEAGEYVLDDLLRCRFLVGAGGTLCPVRRFFFEESHPRAHELQVCALEDEFAFAGRDGLCRLWFKEDGLPGYSWYVPKADGWVNIGIGALAEPLQKSTLSLRELWRSFTTKLSALGLIDGRDRQPGGYTYYLRSPKTAVQSGNCFIAGDAVGLATSDLGEGIGPAIESGLRVADAIQSGAPYSVDRMTRHSWPGFLSGFVRSLI